MAVNVEDPCVPLDFAPFVALFIVDDIAPTKPTPAAAAATTGRATVDAAAPAAIPAAAAPPAPNGVKPVAAIAETSGRADCASHAR